MTSRGIDPAAPAVGIPPPSRRQFVTVPCIFRTEDGEETRLTARLPLDVVLRQID